MDKWIPVKERLPKEEMMADKYHEVQVLVCMDDEFIATTCYTEEGFELWAESGEVIAWMPLPEPYAQPPCENCKHRCREWRNYEEVEK